MARQALTLIGAVVGASFGQPQLGLAIGSIVGGLVDPEVIKVPSVRDAAQQTFFEGAPIALYDGTCGGSGTLVYCSEPDFVTVRERQGKGGPVVESERAYITYAILIGQALQDGPGTRNGIAHLIKVWEDDKLVYDVSPTSQILEESAEYAKGFTFYPGDETQLPDPDLEALLGATNCVAYRGRALFVRKRYDATDRRLTPPNYKFEIATDATAYAPVSLATDVLCYSGAPTALAAASDPGFLANTSKIAISASGRFLAGGGPNEAVWRRFDPTTETWIDLGSLPGLNPGEEVFCLAWSPDETYLAAGMAGHSPLPLPWCPVAVWQRSGDALTRLAPPSSFYHTNSLGGIAWDDAGQRLALTLSSSEVVVYDFVAGSLINPRYVDLGAFGGARNVEFMPGGRYLLASGVARAFLLRDEGDSLQLAASAVVDGRGGIFRDASGGYAIAVGNGSPNGVVTVMEIVESTIGGEALNVESTYTTDIPFSVGPCAISGDRRYLAITASSGQQYPTIVALSAGTPPTCSAVPNPPALGEQVQAVAFPSRSTLPQIEAGATTFNAATLAAARRCGMAAGDFDLSEMAGSAIRGVVIASQAYTGQDCINGLRVAFPSDGSCFDGKIHILKRGGAIDFELDEDFRVEEGSDAEQDEVLRNGDDQRKAPLRRPAKINLMFPNANLGYTFTKANAPNYGGPPGVVTEVTLEVPCVLDEETEAPQLADILDKISRAEADGELVRVFPDYLAAKAVPGTLVRLRDGALQRRVRVQGIRIGDGTRRLSLWMDRAHAYVSQATAPSSAGWPTPPPSLPGETVAAFFNLPALVDEHDRLGVYAAISGQPGTAWTGAKIEWRVQGFTTWEDLGTFTQRAIMGTLLEAMPGASPYWPDWTNPLRVRLLRDDDLESLSELEWLSEQGALAIRRADGTAEIVQSQFAVNDTGQDWTLTHHQRGRLDTDSTTAHAAGARVVVLDGCIFLPLPSSAVGKTLEFRVTSIGSSPETAPTFTLDWNPAISQREWTVSGLQVERAAGLITGSWSPRARLGTDGTPVPSANLDGYQITLTDGSTTRTVTTATPVLSESDAAFSGPVTVTVKAINRWTGPGPGISRTV